MKTDPLLALTPISATEGDAELTRRLDALLTCASGMAPEEAWHQYATLHADFDLVADQVRRTLLTTPLDWTQEEKASARWLHDSCDTFAVLGHCLSQAFITRLGPRDDRVRLMMARTLFFMGETVRWEVVVAPDVAHDFRKPHLLMRGAMAADIHRMPCTMRVEGRPLPCTVESLYFRFLLLARFASGALNCKQIEILDAWMWLWVPVLAGVTAAPRGSALRVDLDSAEGLKRGPRDDEGPSLYLPQDPIQRAYRALVAEFHAGRIMPTTGLASTFRLEEHVAVLAVVRGGLQASRENIVTRAHRRPRGSDAELLVGLGEIETRGLAPVLDAPRPENALAIVREADEKVPAPRQSALTDIYGVKRRVVRFVDESETGLGLEGSVTDCGSIAAGDLVAVRSPGGELYIGKVMRSVPAKTPGRVIIGVRRLAGAMKSVAATLESAGNAAQAVKMLFLPGADGGGHQDAFLVSERFYNQPQTLGVEAAGSHYSMKLNRVREGGRGWVMAGFEVCAARPVARAA